MLPPQKKKMASLIASPLREMKNLLSPSRPGSGKNAPGSIAKENTPRKNHSAMKAGAAAAAAPLVFHNTVYDSPSGDQLKKINVENGKFRCQNPPPYFLNPPP